MLLTANASAELLPAIPPPDVRTLRMSADHRNGVIVLNWTDGTAPFSVARSESADFSAPTRLTYVTRNDRMSTVWDAVLDDGETYYYLVSDRNAAPTVYSIAATEGPGIHDGDTLVIDGVGFDDDCSRIAVYFPGGTSITPISCSRTRIEAQVRAETASRSIAVVSPTGGSRPAGQVKATGTRSHPKEAKPPQATLDLSLLARIEHELSLPSCGMDELDADQSQLDALGHFDQMPYLVAMATKHYSNDQSFLNVTAVGLVGNKGSPRARDVLRALYRDPDIPEGTRSHAATWLAAKFHDPTGLPTIKLRLMSKDTQARADALGDLSHVLNDDNVGLVLPLAADRDEYVLERFGILCDSIPEFRARVVPHLKNSMANASSRDAARIGFVLLLAGDSAGISQVRDFLLHYTGPTSSSDLYQITRWSRALTERGYTLGLDAAAHLLEIYLRTQRDGWFRFTVHTFSDYTSFGLRTSNSDTLNANTARLAIEWWGRNRERIFFDTTTKRFRIR
ncbi:MAG: hypothetical protein LAO51_07625 [Acidobacteriia bacterium]|nr:hypothetical protein [Terriglobia bacterium]